MVSLAEGMFPNGTIAFYHDERYECKCNVHPDCTLTRNRDKHPVAFMHWWLSQATQNWCSTKADHWSDKYLKPDPVVIADYEPDQLTTAEVQFMELWSFEPQASSPK